MEKKQLTNTIGIIVGVIIIIIGLCIQGTSIEASPYSSSVFREIGKDISFGADFYTEIYDITKDVGIAVNFAQAGIAGALNNTQTNICNAVESICKAIGWLIVVIGAFDICYFLKSLCESNDNNPPNSYTDESKQSTVSVVKGRITEDGKWICGSCQTENSMNYGQCKKCGKFRG